MPSIGSSGASFGLIGPQAAAAGGMPPSPIFDADKISAATAQLAALKGELAGLTAQLNGLQASGEAAFSPETSGLEARIEELRRRIDQSGQLTALNNTLEKQTTASTTAANGGKPIEATVKPDQITAKVTEIPPVSVSGEARVTVDPQRVDITLNTDLLNARIDSRVSAKVATIPLASSGARPGAVSMPQAAASPGSK